MIDSIVLYILTLILLTLTLILGHKSARKQKLVHQLSHSFQSIWMEFGVLLRLVGVLNLIPILSRPFDIGGREPCLFILLKKL